MAVKCVECGKSFSNHDIVFIEDDPYCVYCAYPDKKKKVEKKPREPRTTKTNKKR